MRGKWRHPRTSEASGIFTTTGRILFYNSWKENFGKLQIQCSEFHGWQIHLNKGLSGTSGLPNNPGNREITSSSSTKTFFSPIFLNISKNLEKYDLTKPKVSNIHSHLDLKSLSFSTESTKLLQTYCYRHPEAFSLPHRVYDDLREPASRDVGSSLPWGGNTRSTDRSSWRAFTKTRVMQETVLACARLLLIVGRPDLHIATVLYFREFCPARVSSLPGAHLVYLESVLSN